MRTFFSYVFILSFVGISICFFPVERFFDELMNTQKVTETIEDARLYDRLFDALSKNVADQPLWVQLQETPLGFNEPEIKAILTKTFTHEWFQLQVREWHKSLIEYLDGERHDLRAIIVLTDKKNLLIESVMSEIEIKLQALPECSPRDLVTLAANHSKLRSRSVKEGDIRSLIPACRPPQQIQKSFVQFIRPRLEKAISILPDTLNTFSWNAKQEGSNGLTAGLSDLRSVRSFTKTFSWVGYIVVFLLLIGIALLNFSERKKMYSRSGAPLWLSGLVLSVLFTLFYLFVEQSKNIKMAVGSNDFSATPFGEEAVQMSVAVGHAFLSHYIWNMLILSVVFFVAGVGLWIASKLYHPSQTIDSTLGGNAQ